MVQFSKMNILFNLSENSKCKHFQRIAIKRHYSKFQPAVLSANYSKNPVGKVTSLVLLDDPFLRAQVAVECCRYSNSVPSLRQAMLAGDTEMCSFIQQVLLDLGGKVLRKGQLMPFAFWYLRKGYNTFVPRLQRQSCSEFSRFFLPNSLFSLTLSGDASPDLY